MQNNRMQKIFHKIFIPIVILLIVFAIVSYAFNYLSIDRFVHNNAEENIREAFDDIKEQLFKFRRSGEKEFKLQVSSSLISEANDTTIYVYDKDFNEIAIFDNSINKDIEMTAFLSSLLLNFELEEDTLTTINFNGREYLANTYEASSYLNIKEKYFIIVQDMTEKTVLLRESLRNMVVVQIFILSLAVFIIYRIAIGLSQPIMKLAKDSENYSIGKGVTIDDKVINVSELESLRKSLYEMQEKIDAENKRKNTIYENVAHDLRTPLVSILGYADGLKNNIIKDKNKACDVILKTGNQLKEMIENILILSRFDNDTYKSTFEEVDIISLLREQIELTRVMDNNKKIILDDRLDNNVTMNSDKKLLTRIIQNLLSNAIKYADSQIKVIAKPISSNEYKEINQKRGICIDIVNDGGLISKKDIQNIFTRYYKGEDGHFGIGLAVVKSAVDYLGGKIEVESLKNKGTTFRIIFN